MRMRHVHENRTSQTAKRPVLIVPSRRPCESPP
jgi:hypothetical protein